MKYTPPNLEDKIAALEMEHERRQEIVTLADDLYIKLNPFHENFPPCANDILKALEDNLNDLDSWAYEPAKLLEELGHW